MLKYLTATFSKLNAETDAKFLSYREALEKMSSESGDSLHEVALGIKRMGVHHENAIWLRGAERTFIRDEDGYFLGLLLDHTIEAGEIAVPTDEWGNELADPDTHGWWREALVMNLAIEHGLLTPPSLDSPTNKVEQAADTPPHQDAEQAKKMRRLEQELADAKSHVEALKIQLTDAQHSIDDLRRVVGDQSGIALHNTHLMRIALDVQRTYWKTVDRAKSKQEVIVSEVMDKYNLSKPEASAVERVACPIKR